MAEIEEQGKPGPDKPDVEPIIVRLQVTATEARKHLKKLISQRKLYIVTTLLGIAVLVARYAFHVSMSAWLIGGVWALTLLFGLALAGVSTDIPGIEAEVASRESLYESYAKLTGLKRAEDYFDVLVQINVTNLKEYYLLVKVHTQKSFTASLGAGLIGFCFIVASLVAGILTPEQKDVSYVAAGAGVVTEFISGVFFYLYSKTVRQLKEYHDSLLDVQNVLLSFKLIERTEKAETKAEMIGKMIEFLVGKKVSVPHN